MANHSATCQNCFCFYENFKKIHDLYWHLVQRGIECILDKRGFIDGSCSNFLGSWIDNLPEERLPLASSVNPMNVQKIIEKQNRIMNTEPLRIANH